MCVQFVDYESTSKSLLDFQRVAFPRCILLAADVCIGARIGNWDLVSKDLLQKNIIQKRYLFRYFSGLLFNNTHLSSRASRKRYVFCLIISMWLATQIEADMYLVHEKLQTFKQISEMNFDFNKKKSFPFDVLTSPLVAVVRKDFP